MQKYKVMIEDILGPAGYDHALIWIFDGQTVHVKPLPHFEPQAGAYEEKIAFGKESGFSPDQIWDYWTNENRGDGYSSLRNQPIDILAPSVDWVVNHQTEKLTVPVS